MIIKIDKKTLSSYSYLSKKKIENQKTRFSSMKNPTKEIPILDLSKSTKE